MLPLDNLRKKIKLAGGFINSHAHFDRAYTLDNFFKSKTKNHLFEKWKIVNDFKKYASVIDYSQNIENAIEHQIEMGTTSACTFIDVDSVVGLTALIAVKKVADRFPQFNLKIAFQTLKGIMRTDEKELIELILDDMDIIGSLPRADGIGNESKHLDQIMKWGKETGKRIHVHVDQLNRPDEKETELLARKTIEWGLEGKVSAIHGISIAAQTKEYRKELYKLAKDAGLSFITCPSAWIDHSRTEILMPWHNAVTPVDELLENDLIVALGTDNIHDIYKPFSDGDMFFELRLLLESCKIYDEDCLIKIATENGKFVCGFDD